MPGYRNCFFLIARCREKTSFTQDMALALVQLDAQRRKEIK